MHLPIGVSDFRKLITTKSSSSNEGYLYVDKSLFIKEIIDDLTEVIVITRPRRFGKTLNLSMLQHFYAAEVDGQPTAHLFDGLEISKYPECMQLQGKHPVIFLGLKDTKADTYDSAINKIYKQIRQLYSKHRYVLDGNYLETDEKEDFLNILNKKTTVDDLTFALQDLTGYIHKVLGQKVYLLIDEYDTPIQAAYTNGYYDQCISFMRGLLGSALKGNSNMHQAILTGILRVSKESLFSDVNNVEIYSVLHKNYSSHFGFTEDEVNNLLTKAKLPANLKQTKDWYNGYNFAGTTIYNPLSIIKFIKEDGQLMSYWVNTGGSDLIKSLIIKAEPYVKEKLQALISRETIEEDVDEHIVFGDLTKNSAALWSLLLMSGYLTAVSNKPHGRRQLCKLKLPNNEITDLYDSIIEDWLSGNNKDLYKIFLDDLVNGRIVEFEEKLQILIEDTLSSRDVTTKTQESFYHGLMLGFVSGLKETHDVKSNKESGKGFYDVAIIPKDRNKLGIVMEFKAPKRKGKQEINLDNEAKLALEQINKSNYISELKQLGVANIRSIGLAFYKKDVRLAWQ
jgi:hypothetical protein